VASALKRKTLSPPSFDLRAPNFCANIESTLQLHLPFQQLVDSAPAPQSPPPLAPTFAIEFVRVARARRYILRVRPDGTLRVTVPRGGSRREAELFVRRNENWIARERGRVRVEGPPAAWGDGTTILLHGAPTPIAVQPRGDTWRATYGDRTVFVRDLAALRPAIEDDLRTLARETLLPRLHEIAAQHGLQVGIVSIRNQRSRWGSCSRSGNIALNYRLVQMPTEVRDYVLLHELMHLKQQNHSRRFWRLVEAACPAFRDAERWLRSTGKTLF
jgi:predicted metal-dependent hydrolase